ncbi:hypothetical protein P154DRAFT_56359 [Amniculicola lignicola CBS 123094]|uniref:F-box domain-containing protein n=1 Tax=Amniculicola lignicola CBS 123094 TaxID=1392246 RepID=A0A6A5WRL4_9PLEO|nr:hypothetical protein P154DRAFT_56359 [Amniculicola lignicola CBS 123094]
MDISEPNTLPLHLLTLPFELLLVIFTALPSFLDTVSLRCTCRTLDLIWRTHRTTIVNSLIAKFDFYSDAHELLLAQRRSIRNVAESRLCAQSLLPQSTTTKPKPRLVARAKRPDPPLNQADLSDRDLGDLNRNAHRVERFIHDIEQKLVPELRVDGIPESRKTTIYAGSMTHPPLLTATERFRVTRAAYQLWLLTFKSKESIRATALLIRPRELLYLSELMHWARVTDFPGYDTWEMFDITRGMDHAMWMFFNSIYGCQNPAVVQKVRNLEDPVRLLVIWDYWQDNLRNLICRRTIGDLEWDMKGKVRGDLWDYQGGDELLLG